MDEWVVLERANGVAVITLARPPVNALNEEVLRLLRKAFFAAADDASIGAIVVIGTGRSFAAGGDIGRLHSIDVDASRNYVRLMQQTWDEIEAIPKPTIAAVNGYALGGGYELALSCDIRIAASTARVGLPEVQLGLFAAAGGTTRLARIVGKGRALEIIWSCRAVPADEALALGMVESVVDPANLKTEALALAQRLASGPRAAIAAVKRSVLAGLEGGERAQFRTEIREIEALFGNADNREGLAAFLEGREPKFGGA